MSSTTIMEPCYEDPVFWDQNMFPMQLSEPISFDEGFQTTQLDLNFSFDDIYHPMENSAPNIQSPRSTSPRGLRWASIETSQHNKQAQRPKLQLQPSTQAQPRRRTRRPPSGEALDRRRQQNRAAQFAFRERSKKQVDEMRQELIRSSEYNQAMYARMQELLERTESLKRDLESALSMRPPVMMSFEGPEGSRQGSRLGSLEVEGSPESNSDENQQDEEIDNGASTI